MISKKNRTSTQISPAMKKLLASLFFVFTTLFTYGQQFHVASYNVRYANPADEQRGNGWSQRCPVICNQIAYESFDRSACRRFLNPSSTTCRTVCLVTTVVSESAATTAKRPASTLRYSIKKIASSCWIPAVSGCRKLPISRAWDGMRNIRVFAVGHNCRTETPEIPCTS